MAKDVRIARTICTADSADRWKMESIFKETKMSESDLKCLKVTDSDERR